MPDPADSPPEHIYIANLRESQLWTPPGRGFAHDAQTQLLPDSGLWVHSNDASFALKAKLRTYPVDEFLALISRASYLRLGRSDDLRELMRRQGWGDHLVLRQHQMALLVNLILDEYDWNVERAWPVQSDAEKLRLLVECTRLANNVVPPRSPDGRSSDGWGYATLMRIAYQQFTEFEPLRSFYPRAYLIFREYARQAEGEVGITLTEVLRTSVGLDIEEAMFLAFGFFSLLSEGKRGHLIERDFMTNSPDLPGITQERMSRLFDWLSIEYEGFRVKARADAVSSEDGYELYNFNPLIEHPFIRTPRGHYVVPIGQYLFRRVSTGLFYDLIRSREKGRVGHIVGRAIELYVRRLIADVPVHGTIIPEQQYAPGKTTCEWMVDEPDRVVLIECKRKSVDQRSKTTGMREDMKRSLAREDAIVDGVAKLKETADAIRQGKIRGLPAGKPVIGLLITMDEFFTANERLVRSLIAEMLTARGTDLGDLEYQICSVPGFEELCRYLWATEQHLSTALRTKIDGFAPDDWVPEMSRWDFSMWVNKVWPKGVPGRIPSHELFYDEVLEELVERFKAGD